MAGPKIYERIVVDPPPDANYGPVRARDPEDAARIRELVAAGVSPIVVAQRFEVSVRTIYRYLADDGEVITVRAGAWLAEFSVAPKREPRRLTPWRRDGGPPPETQRLRARADREGR